MLRQDTGYYGFPIYESDSFKRIQRRAITRVTTDRINLLTARKRFDFDGTRLEIRRGFIVRRSVESGALPEMTVFGVSTSTVYRASKAQH